MDTILSLIKAMNVGDLIAMLGMLWFFYSRSNGKIIDLKIELKNEMKNVAEKVEKLETKIDDVDKRLCRIEGSLATQGHCLFTKSQSDHKSM